MFIQYQKEQKDSKLVGEENQVIKTYSLIVILIFFFLLNIGPFLPSSYFHRSPQQIQIYSIYVSFIYYQFTIEINTGIRLMKFINRIYLLK